MKRFSIAEARKKLPELVRSAEAGEIVEVTRRGEPVAVLISFEDFQGRGHAHKKSAWEAIVEFRAQHQEADFGDPDEIWKDVRDRSAGRDVEI